MLKQLSFLIVLIIANAWSVSAFQGAEWIKVAPAGSGFSVMMPSTPKEEKKVENNYPSYTLSVATDISHYLARYTDYEPGIKIDPTKELAVNRDGFVRAIEGTLIESREISLEGRPGLEFTAESSRFFARCRFFFSGNRLYMLAAGGAKPQNDPASLNRFLTSFAFTKSDSVQKP